MPAPGILEALGMTREEWGRLPPESESPQRRELREKAQAIIKQQREADPASRSLHEHVQALQERVEAIETKLRRAPAGEYDRKIIENLRADLATQDEIISALDARLKLVEELPGAKPTL